MQPLWKILAPVELNERAECAVEHATEFANATAAQLVLLHVAGEEFYGDEGAGWPQAPIGGPLADIPVQRNVVSGEAAASICRYADFIDANMVLLMPRRRSAWPMFRGRSVTSAVLASTRRPVQVWSRTAARGDYRFRCRTVLCVVRLDGTDGPLIDSALVLAARSGAEIAILHVLPEISEALLVSGVAEPGRPLSRQVALDRIRALVGALPVPCSISIMVGALRKCVAIAARQTRADLVIVGRGMPGERAAAGADARAVLRMVGCPVISIPAAPVPANPQPAREFRAPKRENVLCDI